MDTLPQRVQLQMEQSQIIHPSTNTSIKQSVTENEIKQSRGNINSTDLAGEIVVHQTKEFAHKFLFLRQSERNLEMEQRINDMDQKLQTGNVGAFLLNLSQTQEETGQCDI
ncbi:MAG: hypothetical protein EZS28_044978 [Streblomastix strix]|uniref:Uncharacterized protein n=1 Tax=Streblomastix strix TaxID=222440 RepID=A0A5J4TQ26_9EUKA|nr:MAG: hypothetical protein EZS28_044978 [Streblomastix strix]